MQKDLFTMERAIALNIYQPRQAKYRGLDIVPGKSRTAGPARYLILRAKKKKKRLTFFSLQVNERVGISQVGVSELKG